MNAAETGNQIFYAITKKVVDTENAASYLEQVKGTRAKDTKHQTQGHNIMARKPKETKMTATVLPTNALLVAIVAATNAGSFTYATIADATANGLLDAASPLVECNPTMTNPANPDEVAFRATPAGIAFVGPVEAPAEGGEAPAAGDPVVSTAGTDAPATETKAAAPVNFEIDDNIPMPTGKRTRTGASKYPFDALEVGKSFHVPATADDENPAKTLASTVATANLRYATPKVNADGSPVLREGIKRHKDEATGKVTTTREMVPEMDFSRKFVVRAVDATDPRGKGARVWREL